MPELEPDGHESAGKPKKKDKGRPPEIPGSRAVRAGAARRARVTMQLIDADLGH
jgi:hypothetical protein